MSAQGVRTDFDPQKAEAFSGRLLGALNNGSLCLMMSVGHRTGLFDVMTTRRLAHDIQNNWYVVTK